MKSLGVLLFLLLLPSCQDNPFQVEQGRGRIEAYVHFGSQPVSGVKIVLVETGDTLRTDASGLAIFSVVAGRHIVRALGIQGPGPVLQTLDYDVNAQPGATIRIDIFDCLGCL